MNLFISINKFHISLFVSQSLTIMDLKCKLEMITGGAAATMKLSVFDKENQVFTTDCYVSRSLAI